MPTQKVDNQITKCLADLRARLESQRGSHVITDAELDAELAARGVDWREVKIQELQAEIDRLRAEQLEAY